MRKVRLLQESVAPSIANTTDINGSREVSKASQSGDSTKHETRFTLAHGGFRGGGRGVIAGHALWKAKNDNKKDRMKQRSGAEKLIGKRRFAGRRWGWGSVERWERRDGPADLPAVCMFSPYRNQEQENAQAFPPRPLLSFASGINSPFSCARM